VKNRNGTDRTTLGAATALLALLVLGSSASAARMWVQMSSAAAGTFGAAQEFPTDDPPLPGWWEIEGEDDPDDGGDIRAHSDVPDLPPGGNDPPLPTSGGSWYEPPKQPTLTDLILGGNGPSVPMRPDRPRVEVAPGVAGGSTVPGPGALVVLAGAGAGMCRRRRR
jgi:hypothetical protein